MKIILSRKGFDSANGGVASPLFHDGSAVSLPIPAGRRCPARFDQVMAPGTAYEGDIGTLVEQLSRGRVCARGRCHIDPDLDAETTEHDGAWQAAFGQVGAAQSHLKKERVGVGDLFLFFGWFRQAEEVDGTWRYRRDAPSLHRLFGWLQIGEILQIGEDVQRARSKLPRLRRHPHLWGYWDDDNTVYVARDELLLAGAQGGTAGAGLFGPDPGGRLVLTAAGARTRSEWRLPAAFKPGETHPGLSYHRDPKRWSKTSGQTRVRAVARGQEFVLDANGREEAVAWAASLWRPPNGAE